MYVRVCVCVCVCVCVSITSRASFTIHYTPCSLQVNDWKYGFHKTECQELQANSSGGAGTKKGDSGAKRMHATNVKACYRCHEAAIENLRCSKCTWIPFPCLILSTISHLWNAHYTPGILLPCLTLQCTFPSRFCADYSGVSPGR